MGRIREIARRVIRGLATRTPVVLALPEFCPPHSVTHHPHGLRAYRIQLRRGAHGGWYPFIIFAGPDVMSGDPRREDPAFLEWIREELGPDGRGYEYPAHYYEPHDWSHVDGQPRSYGLHAPPYFPWEVDDVIEDAWGRAPDGGSYERYDPRIT